MHFNTNTPQFLNTISELIMNGFEISKLKDVSKDALSGIYQGTFPNLKRRNYP